MKFVVTGSSGFIGANLVRALVSKGHKVYAATTRDRLNGVSADLCRGAELLKIKDLLGIPDDLLAGAVLIHCAWQDVPRHDDTSHYTHALEQLEFVKKVSLVRLKKVVIVGTCIEYGASTGAVSVSSEAIPITPYGHAKTFVRHAAERLLLETSKSPFTWARLFYVYGDGQQERSLYAQLVQAIGNKDTVFKMSGGEQLCDYMSVDEVAECLYSIAVNGSPKVVNVCSGTPISIRSFVERVLESKGAKLELDLGFYPYRDRDSFAMWGAESFEDQMLFNTRCE